MRRQIFSLLFSFFFLFPLSLHGKNIEKNWTCVIYIAGDNDLDYFAKRNIEEMKRVGSTKNINILVQLDRQGAHEKTQRLYIEKGKATQVNRAHPSSQQKLDFGSAFTLIDCMQWAITEYPAQHYALILWNHGIGILDSIGGKATSATEIFSFNAETNMLEINRSINYLDFIRKKTEERLPRGVCFSDTYGTYLTNQKLDYALKTVTQQLPNNKKIDIIGFDACLMAMLEVGNLIEPYSNFMVASQELELGTGWPYHRIFEPFKTQSLSPEEFANHIVESYHHNYKSITYDYTLSSINLSFLSSLEAHLKKTVELLHTALDCQRNNSVVRLIRASRSKRLCTYFSEPSYIDLHHFLCNMHDTVEFMDLLSDARNIKQQLKVSLCATKNALEEAVSANKCGKNLNRAKGLSIYFPSRYIDPSYRKTPFALSHPWSQLLQTVCR